MKLDDVLKIIQQLLGMYKSGKDKERIEAVLENIYKMLMEDADNNDEIIDFLDSVMFDVDYLIENRNEIIAKSDDEKENKKRRRKMVDMFSEEY